MIKKGNKIIMKRNSITEVDYAYLAGIIDGEGSILIHKCRQQLNKNRGNGKSSPDKTPRFVVDVKVSMTCRKVMYWLKDNFGGSLHKMKREKHYKEIYSWQVRANQASKLLKIILPFLKTKQLQAVNCIYFQDNLIRKTGWKGDGIQPNELKKREMHYNVNKTLNTGFDPDIQYGNF